MSDNPFADLLGSFKRGWETAGKAENLSTTRIKSRPSFWNPFLTWRDEEERQLSELYEDVKKTYDASPFASEEFLQEITSEIVVTAFTEISCIPSDDVLSATSNAVLNLLNDEFFSFVSFEGQNRHQQLEGGEAQKLKRALERKRRFLNDSDRHFEVGCQKIRAILSALLEFLPETSRRRENNDYQTPLFQLHVDLIDAMDRPTIALEGTLTEFFGSELYDNGLFEDLQAQFEHNLLVASGLDPENKAVPPKQIIMPTAAKGKTPSELASTYLKDTPFEDFFARPLPLTIPDQARFEHCHILGGTGHGKTQCMQLLLIQDLARALYEPISVVVIDSQGDLIRKISSSVLFDPEDDESLADRFILIDPSDIEHPPALNLFDAGLERMEGYTPRQRELAFNSLVDIYGRFFGALLGAELTAKQSTLFRYLARLMLTVEGATIHTLIDLMDDASPFKDHIEKLDPTARRFFENEFSRKGFHATRQQIKQRLYAVLSIPTFDRLFSAPKSKISFFDAFNSGKIILINTAKDLLKSDGTAIFGRFILALIEHAVMERANLAEDKRNPVFLYMDEAQDYFDETVETLLVQSRKYNFGLTLAHQNLAQLAPRLRAIFMSNTTIKLAGGVSDADARAIAPDMHTTPDFLLSMKKRQDVSDFALSIRNLTSHAVKVEVPLGFLEDADPLEPQQYEALLALNRERVGYTPQAEKPLEDAPSATHSAPASPETGTEHRELQKRIKAAAQKRGFSATIEKRVLDGKGRVDVAMERDDLRIACEVSVTTKVEHERHNIEKCLAAGFTHVWVTSPDAAQLQKLREGLQSTLSPEVQERVSFLSEEDLVAELENFPISTSTSQSKVRGYTVKTIQIKLNAGRSQDRRDRLSTVLASLSDKDDGGL